MMVVRNTIQSGQRYGRGFCRSGVASFVGENGRSDPST